MAASFPSAVKTYTDLVDGVDKILASHPNSLQQEVNAIETELGTNPRSISDTSTPPGATPASVAEYLDMVAYQLKAILGLSAWSSTPTGGMVSGDGWVQSTDTWVYSSASVFTIAGVNRTAQYSKGTRLRWKQGGSFLYGVVYSSAFVTDTTVTIFVNTDYVIANAAISYNSYSHVLSPEGYPDVFNFAAVFTGFSANPTNVVNRFSVQGSVCTVYHREAASGTSNLTTFTVGAPCAAKTLSNATWGNATWELFNNSANAATGAVFIASAATAFSLAITAGGAWTGSGTKRASFTIDFEF